MLKSAQTQLKLQAWEDQWKLRFIQVLDVFNVFYLSALYLQYPHLIM